jgi:hypothetical protein
MNYIIGAMPNLFLGIAFDILLTNASFLMYVHPYVSDVKEIFSIFRSQAFMVFA